MADCLKLLEEQYPELSRDEIEDIFRLMEAARKDGSLSISKKVERYKELISSAKFAQSMKVKNNIDAELKLNKNLEVARNPRFQRTKSRFLSPLETFEPNSINVDSVTSSNVNQITQLTDAGIRAAGLEEAVISDSFSRKVYEVVVDGKRLDAADPEAPIVNKLADIYKSMNEFSRGMQNSAGASVFKNNRYMHRTYHNGARIGEVDVKEWMDI